MWNIVDPGATGSTKSVRLTFRGLPPNATVTISRVDGTHGNPMPAYQAMGSPQYPTMAQVKQLNTASALPPPEERHLEDNGLDLKLAPNALVLVKVQP